MNEKPPYAGIACRPEPFRRQAGAIKIDLACILRGHHPAAIEHIPAEIIINPVVGPEVVTGSTRMKAGTATKLVLNTLTTGAMIRLGKVYGNLMVDLHAVNNKLRDRSLRILMELTGLSRRQAQTLLRRADGQLKAAVVMHFRRVDLDRAMTILAGNDQILRRAIVDTGETA